MNPAGCRPDGNLSGMHGTHLNESGAMLSKGWHWIDGSCYYMDASGKMMTDTWIDGSYVNSLGVWIP